MEIFLRGFVGFDIDLNEDCYFCDHDRVCRDGKPCPEGKDKEWH